MDGSKSRVRGGTLLPLVRAAGMASAYGGGVGGVTMTWEEELMHLMEDTGIRYSAAVGAAEEEEEDERKVRDRTKRAFADGYDYREGAEVAEESLRDQLAGFVTATGEMVMELGRGCWDIAQQGLAGAEDTYVGKKVKGHCAVVSRRLEFLNEYLPEDRDPGHAWPVVICVFLLALIVFSVNDGNASKLRLLRKLYINPPSASRIQLPDGRYVAYQEQGVAAESARFSMIAPHSFLSSRLAGIPGIKAYLLEEFGVRLITYDLPGFGESDPHQGRNLTSSALDMHHLAHALGIVDRFWVVGYSSGAMHAWAALHYIPDRIAGVAMFAPIVNPYDSSMSKEERQRTWEKWMMQRKLMYILARSFPSLLPYFYRRSFLSGRLGQPEKWLSLSLGEKVQKQEEVKGLLLWLKSLYRKAEHKQAGFVGPIHVWQGMDDNAVPPSVTEFIQRSLPRAMVYRLLGEGHFSYFCFCDDSHRDIFSTLFGDPKGPLGNTLEVEETEDYIGDITSGNYTEKE